MIRTIRVQVPARSAKSAVREISTRNRFRDCRVDVPRRRSTRPLLLTIRLTIRLSLTFAGRLSMSGWTLLWWLGGLRIIAGWGWIGCHTSISMLWKLRREHAVLRGRGGHPIWRWRVGGKPCGWRGVPDTVRPHKAWDLLGLGGWALRWVAVRS